eukprot:527450-Hanusia_phi.AAC.5
MAATEGTTSVPSRTTSAHGKVLASNSKQSTTVPTVNFSQILIYKAILCEMHMKAILSVLLLPPSPGTFSSLA